MTRNLLHQADKEKKRLLAWPDCLWKKPGMAILLWSLALPVFAQENRQEIGNPIAGIHTSKEYNAHSQNFAAVQDKRGLMYFGNFTGVLEYDGAT